MVIHHYEENAINRDQEGWDKKYKEQYVNAYGSIDRFRFSLLESDASLFKIEQFLFQEIMKLRSEGQKVHMLDVGCGTGHQIASVAYLCDTATGFDISKEVIENNQRLNSTVHFCVGDALNHPEFEHEMTLVLMGGVLYSISDDLSLHDRILGEVYKTLSDNGTFIFYHRGYLSITYWLNSRIRNIIDKFQGKVRRKYSMSYYSEGYIRSLFDKNGFTVRKVEKADFAFPLTQGFIGKLLISGKQAETYNSYDRLNLLGKAVYGISKYFFNSLSARSAIFIAEKTLKKVNKMSENIHWETAQEIAINNLLTPLLKHNKVYVYGSGKYAELFLGYIYKNSEITVEKIFDENTKAYDTINNIPVVHMSPEALGNAVSEESIVIIASSRFEKQIYDKLRYLEEKKVNCLQLHSLLEQHSIII